MIGIAIFKVYLNLNMQFHIITLFPEMIEQFCSFGVLGRAVEKNLVSIKCWNPRDYAKAVSYTHLTLPTILLV